MRTQRTKANAPPPMTPEKIDTHPIIEVEQAPPLAPEAPAPPVFPMSDTVRAALDAQGKTKQAITELLAVRTAIDSQLAQLGHTDGPALAPRLGRPPGRTRLGRPPGRPRFGRPPQVAAPAASRVAGKHKFAKPCPICESRGVKSYNGMGLYDHDRRSHRAENLKAIAEFERTKGKHGRPALK